MNPPGDVLFAAESIGVSFRGRVVLKAASIWARPGSITVLLGRNGCGKTTLIRAALGLGRRDFGFIRYSGRTWERPHLSLLARLGLFYLPDRGLLSWRRSVNWHLRALGQSLPSPLDFSLADTLDIDSLRQRTARALSGGERRRVEVALAILRGPDCLVVDEPLAELSPTNRRRIASALRKLADRGCAVIATRHEIEDLLDLGRHLSRPDVEPAADLPGELTLDHEAFDLEEVVESMALAGLVAVEIQSRTAKAVVVSPASVGDLLSAKGLTGTLLAFSQAGLVLLLVGAFGYEPLLLLLALLIGSIMTAGFGMLAGSAGRDFMTTIFISMVFIIPMAVPAISALFPGAASFWVQLLPTYGFIETIVGVTAYGQSWGDVTGYLLMSAAWCVAIFAAGWFILRRRVEAL